MVPLEQQTASIEETALIEQLSGLRSEMLEVSERWRPWVAQREADRDRSARNLLQYLTLRRHDLRDAQYRLIELGLSSMADSEGHVQATVDAVLAALQALINDMPRASPNSAPIGFAQSRELLAQRAEALLGPARRKRPTRIMVTMPSEAATNPKLVSEMLSAGMDCMRINCAHDSPAAWRAMCKNLDAAQRHTEHHACVLVDLPGPKLRTGSLAPQPKHDGKGDYLRLRVGEHLTLTRIGSRANPDPEDDGGVRIECSLDEAFAGSARGHRVFLDDGKLGGIVESVTEDEIGLLITSAGPDGSKLRAEKGINLPDAVLDIDLLGSHSEAALEFAAAHADLVGLSFVSRARDVRRVSAYLEEHSRADVGMILKIETQRGFEHLPGMLLEALGGDRPAGVMIARGDLAVECGYERLAEVQEEILWLCQAAHMPVIWATQVLDQLAKTGRPSRSEITDAAMAGRAECVMLNKGPRILEAICVLDDILRRMERHHRKQRRLLPQLKAADYLQNLA
jgi:pyruvate kinase